MPNRMQRLKMENKELLKTYIEALETQNDLLKAKEDISADDKLDNKVLDDVKEMSDEDKDKKDHLYWAIYNNYFCPACFDKKKRTGNIVRRDLLDHGMLSDKERDKLMALDIENKKVQLKAKGIL